MENDRTLASYLRRAYPAKRRQSPSKLSRVDGTDTQETVEGANHDMFIVQRRLQRIEDGMIEVHERMVSCRQFATIWQRTDKENDAIFEDRKKQIYNNSGVERPSDAGKDEEKVSGLASTDDGDIKSVL